MLLHARWVDRPLRTKSVGLNDGKEKGQRFVLIGRAADGRGPELGSYPLLVTVTCFNEHDGQGPPSFSLHFEN